MIDSWAASSSKRQWDKMGQTCSDADVTKAVNPCHNWKWKDGIRPAKRLDRLWY